MITKHNTFQMEIEEVSIIQIEQTSSKKSTVTSWFRRIFLLDNLSNEEHHRPIFIMIMSILHIFILLLTYIDKSNKGQSLITILFNLGQLYIPCMRPTSDEVRLRIVNCQPLIENTKCHYDDIVRYKCFSFMYPHQLWRMITLLLFHGNWLHLFSNLSAQLIQGIPLEIKYGWARIAIVYSLSGLGASLTGLITLGQGSAIGASGCLYGLMFFLIVDRLVAMQTKCDDRFFVIIQLSFLLLPYIFIGILLMMIDNVQHIAHFGGALVGFLLGISMLGCPFALVDTYSSCATIGRRMAFIFLLLYYIITMTIFFCREAPVLDRITYDFSLKNQTIIDLV